MDDSPIPDYLIDMLKEAGEIDEDGKPVNDFFDPDEDDTFGTQRQRDRVAEEVKRGTPFRLGGMYIHTYRYFLRWC